MTHNGHLAGLGRWISKSRGRRNHSCPRYVCNIGMPRRAGVWPKSDAIDRCYQIWLDKGLINSQNKTPKPKLTFVIVGKRFVSRVAFRSHRIDCKFPGIIFGFSRWMECSSASFRFDFLVRLTDYFFRGADSTGNCPAGFMADRGVQSPTTRDFYLQSHGGLKGSELSDVFGSIVVLISIILQPVGPPTTPCSETTVLVQFPTCRCLISFLALKFYKFFIPAFKNSLLFFATATQVLLGV
jgi:hypothetical protein